MMEGANLNKWFSTCIGVLGGALATAFGGWTDGMSALIILMCIDYCCGLIVAGVFHNSKKTENGKLESRAGLKGIIKKVGSLALIIVAVQVERYAHTTFVRDAVIIGLCTNESLSILENAGLMGVYIPKPLKDAIEVLRNENDKTDPQK